MLTTNNNKQENGLTVQSGKRFNIDVSISVSQLLNDIKKANTTLETLEKEQLLFGSQYNKIDQSSYLYWDSASLTLYTENINITGLTQNSVLFAGTDGVIDEDITNFLWDDTNNILTATNIKTLVGATIDEFSTDGTLVDNSDTALVTEKAIKTYIDSYEHGDLVGLADDDHTQYLLADGTRALTAAWDAGSFKITAETFESDVTTGTAPLTIASTTVCTNLNADLWDGYEFADYLNQAVKTTSNITHNELSLTNNCNFLDNYGSIYGTGGNSTIYYNGTHLVLNSQLVGSGGFSFLNGNIGINTTILDNTKVNVFFNPSATDTSETGFVCEIDTTNDTQSSYQAKAITATVRYRGTQSESASNKGISSLTSNMFCYNTATTEYISAFRFDTRNLGTGTITHCIGAWIPFIQNTGGGVITNNYGVKIDNQTTAINNYGVYSNISSGANKWNIYAVGTADNFFNGGLLVDSDTAGLELGKAQDAKLHYNGVNVILNPKVVGSGVVLLDTNSKVCFRDTALGLYSQADTYLDLFADGGVRIGDSASGAPTNFTQISSNGDITFHGSSGFYPVRISQSAQPTPDTGELVIWRDTDDGKVYLVYNDTDSGVKQIEMV